MQQHLARHATLTMYPIGETLRHPGRVAVQVLMPDNYVKKWCQMIVPNAIADNI